MKIGGIDKLCEQISEIAALDVQIEFGGWDERGVTSPIEKIFVTGLVCFVRLQSLATVKYWMFSDVFTCGEERPPYFDTRVAEPGTVLVEYQKLEIDWRADFVLSAPSFSQKKLIVECDGHDFHERTKDQAIRDRGRDRAAQAAGYRILRFTGAELYRDPLKCVTEALDVLKQFADAE